MKTVIVGLSEKVRVREDIEQDLHHQRVLNAENDQARKLMHHDLEGAAQQMRQEAEKNKKYQELMIRESQVLTEKSVTLTETITQKTTEIETIRYTCN